jgi:hypothetical protein
MKEKELCIVLGLSRTQMRELRSQYSEGEDWVVIPSKRPKNLWEVQWTDAGVEKLRDTIGVKDTEALIPPTTYKAIVVGRFPNPRILQVEMQGNKHNVLCRDNKKFKAGMPVWLRWDGARWVVARHPRFEGKY